MMIDVWHRAQKAAVMKYRVQIKLMVVLLHPGPRKTLLILPTISKTNSVGTDVNDILYLFICCFLYLFICCSRFNND